jgi:hypothetical protein
MTRVNWLAVIVSAVVYMAIGMLWYGILFEKAWMEYTGITVEQAEAAGATPYLVSFLNAIIFALMLNWVLPKLGARSAMDGVKYGVVLGLGFIFVTGLTTYGFSQNQTGHAVIDFLYPVVCLAAQGAIIMAWRKAPASAPETRMQN